MAEHFPRLVYRRAPFSNKIYPCIEHVPHCDASGKRLPFVQDYTLHPDYLRSVAVVSESFPCTVQDAA